MVIPSSASCFITESTSPTSSGSSADVTSSNSITFGSIASARAIATLCCCPPESCPGLTSSLSLRPTLSSSCAACSRAWSPDIFSTVSGPSITFRIALMWGKRLNCWKIMPMLRPDLRQVGLRIGDLHVLEEDPAPVGLFEPVEAPEESALAGAARADDDHHFAALHLHGDPLQHLQGIEALVQVLNAKHDVGHGPSGPSSLPGAVLVIEPVDPDRLGEGDDEVDERAHGEDLDADGRCPPRGSAPGT